MLPEPLSELLLPELEDEEPELSELLVEPEPLSEPLVLEELVVELEVELELELELELEVELELNEELELPVLSHEQADRATTISSAVSSAAIRPNCFICLFSFFQTVFARLILRGIMRVPYAVRRGLHTARIGPLRLVCTLTGGL